MEIILLLEVLKLLWFLFAIVRYYKLRQKEKELVNSLESLNQRLLLLEKSLKEKSDND
jgi:hypothetical protein